MRLFIELPTWLGDSVMASMAIELIATNFKDAQITFFGAKMCLELYKPHPNAKNFIIDESKKAKLRLLNLAKTMRNLGEFDMAISFRSSFSAKFGLFFIKAHKKALFNKRINAAHQAEKYAEFIAQTLNLQVANREKQNGKIAQNLANLQNQNIENIAQKQPKPCAKNLNFKFTLTNAQTAQERENSDKFAIFEPINIFCKKANKNADFVGFCKQISKSNLASFKFSPLNKKYFDPNSKKTAVQNKANSPIFNTKFKNLNSKTSPNLNEANFKNENLQSLKTNNSAHLKAQNNKKSDENSQILNQNHGLKLYFEPKIFARKTLGLNPGASYGSAKRWYPLYFAKVAQEFANDFDIVIFGGSNESEICDEIARQLSKNGVKFTNLCGKTTIKELCEMIAGIAKSGGIFITNDSGPMHIAAAFKTPTIGLFGPTRWRETSPYANENARILHLNLPCMPCMKRVCPLGTHACMKNLIPQMAIDAIKELEENKI
ncbi:MAG: lipopolysaccharide heptosyltransferase II [Campylobacter sp.]